MRKILAAFVVGSFVLANVGCMTSAKFVEKGRDSCVVEVKSNSPEEMEKARALVKQQYGEGFKETNWFYDNTQLRTDQRTGQPIPSNDNGKMFVKFERSGTGGAAAPAGAGSLPGGQPIATTGGMQPMGAGSGIQQTGFQQPAGQQPVRTTAGTGTPTGGTTIGGYNPYGR